MVQATDSLYVVRDDEILNGEPIMRGSRTPVRAIVDCWRMGLAPEEILEGMPHIALSQILGALAYYSDHQAEIDILNKLYPGSAN